MNNNMHNTPSMDNMDTGIMDISPTASSSHAPNNRSQGNSSQRHHKNTNVHERQHKHKQQLLKTSNVSIPTSSRKQKRIGSGFKRVERFNYAKALLRSDHELEKLSRKIRSEINESELFELAQAAEMLRSRGSPTFPGDRRPLEATKKRKNWQTQPQLQLQPQPQPQTQLQTQNYNHNRPMRQRTQNLGLETKQRRQ